MSNFDINVDRQTDGRTENWTPIYRTLLQAGAIKKEKKIHERKHPKHVFLKINYAEIILHEIFVWIEADQH